MNSLIEDISTFNKLNRETTLHLEKVNLKRIIYEVLSILEVSASPEVEIVFNYPADIPTEIETDSTKLKQVFMNIVKMLLNILIKDTFE